MAESSSRGALVASGARSGTGVLVHEVSQPSKLRHAPVIVDRGNLASKSLSLAKDSSVGSKRRGPVIPDRDRSVSSKFAGSYVHHRKLADITQDINSVKKFRKMHQIQMENQLMD